MKRTDALSVGEIINRVVANAGLTDVMAAQQACYLWPEVVGQGINRYTSRRYIEGRILHVYITSAALRNDLVMLRDRLIAELNRRAGGNAIDDIKIH